MPDRDENIPSPPPGRHLRARDGVLVVTLAVMLLILFKGESIRSSGEEMQPGFERNVVLAVGHPSGWIAERLPFDKWGNTLTSWLSPGEQLADSGGFDQPVRQTRQRAVPPVSPESFDPASLGAKPRPPRKLHTVLVTGDSMTLGLDLELGRRLAGRDGVRVIREPHLGTGISKTGFVDWGKLSTQQVGDKHPEATVVFIGANEGFDMPGPNGKKVVCCGPDWAAEYAFRVRRMMNTYRQRGAARVYYLTLPFPREKKRQEIARAVNAAIQVASVPYRSSVRVIDTVPIFTPGERYRAAMDVDGRKQIVRQPDGIHLNGTGSKLAADAVMKRLDADFGG
ncbi:MAG TPA: GDSL-type esterase/lipase family protein [Thermoleophilaceae bacterium]|jgi:hypothetical protein